MPKYAEPDSPQELRDAVRRLIQQSGLTEAEVSRRIGFHSPAQLNRRLNQGKPRFSREEIERICAVCKASQEQRAELLRLRGDEVVITPAAPVAELPRPHQLRAPVADFFGREDEIAALLGALRSGAAGAAISGVAGMGGIGKTELALKVAAGLRDHYPDAQILLPLQGSREPSLAPAAALRLVIRAFAPEAQLPEDGPELEAAYRSVLNGKRVLLLADDAKDAPQVKPLLPPPGSALLITSRRRMVLPGMRRIDLERLDEAAVVALLRSIAAHLSEEETRQIATACGRLPLALRIAGSLLAANTRLAVPRYLARLADERQRLAALRDPDDPDLDVEASIKLSYDLLPPAAQTTLCTLGLFAASFDEPAAAAVLAEADPGALEERLGLLYRRSLLEFDQEAGRYDLHELVRVFALARLDAAERAARLRHARHYIAVANEAQRQYLAGNEGVMAGLALFDRERVQIDAARRWLQGCARDAETDALLSADANATAHIGDLRYATLAERIPQLEQALAAAQRIGNQAAQGAFLSNLGTAYADLGDAHKAIDFYQRHLALARAIGDPHGEANALGGLGNAYIDLGNAGQAINFYRQILALARTTGSQRDEANALSGLGHAYAALGDIRQAIEFYQQRLAIARAIGDRQDEAAALGNLGVAYADLGDDRRAIEFYEQTLALARTIGDRRGEAGALGNLGSAYFVLGDARKAIEFHQQRLVISRAIDDRRGIVIALGNLGLAYGDLGDTHQAIDFQQQTLTLARAMGDRRSEAGALGNLGSAYENLGDIRQAIDFYQQHLALARTIGDRQSEAIANWTYGLALVRQGEPAQALPLLEAGLAYFQQLGHPQAISMANNVAHVRAHGTLPEQNDTPATPADLPEAVQDAIKRQDRAALDAALAALPDAERARVEALLAALDRRVRGEASRRSMKKIVAGLPPELHAALAQGDQTAAQAVLAALPKEQRQRVIADLRVLQIQAVLAAQQEQQHQQLIALVRAIAIVAAGDDAPRQAVEDKLAELEQSGWMLRGPVARLWAGERNRDALVAGLDRQDTRLIEAALELTAAYERGALRTPTQVLADLPEPVRTAVQNHDQAAFEAALAALDEAAQVRVAALLAELSGETAEEPEPPAGPDIDQIIQQFLPLLGDIALAALGDEAARQVAEAMLPAAEERGWRLADVARRIWEGQRDAGTLTEGLDTQHSALVQQALRLVAGGRDLIGVAYSRDIDRTRREADSAFAQARAARPQDREALTAGFEAVAAQAEGYAGAPWQALAAHLRSLAAQLRGTSERKDAKGHE